MGVAAHLGIKLGEYDTRIRTFIPAYEEMLQAAASVVPVTARKIVDLGIGTGALSACCLRNVRRARIFGIDADPRMMDAALRRLQGRAELMCGNFIRAELPTCEAVVASFALHHVRTRVAKEKLYRRIRKVLRPGGLLVNVDCQPARDRKLACLQMDAWRSHLMKSYSRTKATEFLSEWAKEDVYIPLEDEIELMKRGGFVVEVVWRRGAFAVLAARAANLSLRFQPSYIRHPAAKARAKGTHLL
jgi:tRNA (cmo5U34)-methyltransferase